jgi:hypothetical protein
LKQEIEQWGQKVAMFFSVHGPRLVDASSFLVGLTPVLSKRSATVSKYAVQTHLRPAIINFLHVIDRQCTLEEL